MPVRRLAPEDAPLLKSVRLEALADAPDAFGSTYEREVAFTHDGWTARLDPNANPHFVDQDEDGAVRGLVAGVRADGDRSTLYLVAMWVVPDARGTGSADRLVERVIEWARTEPADVLRLHVMEGNRRAERVYQRHGFVSTGHSFVRERDGLREIEMARQL
jgi:GNAT superfamily N-acetyltransferase